MHLAERAYLLIVATALLAIAATWSADPDIAGLWRWPAAILLLGVAAEALLVRELLISAAIDTAAHAALGCEQAAAFTFSNSSPRELTLEFAPLMAAGFAPLRATRCVTVPAHGSARDDFTLLPIGLGPQPWPPLPLRLRGPLGLAWWPRTLAITTQITIAPDAVRSVRARPRGQHAGIRPRRTLGAGSELYQLRAYAPGDPLARIDWKASARSGALVTREFSEDQHLDILIALDAGRMSRVRAGRLDRLGLYANIAARFANLATPNDDRVGLVVFADRPLAVCAPERGLRGVTRIYQALQQLIVEPAESDPVAAALRIRALLKHRALVIILTAVEDSAAASSLARAVGLLSPPHRVVIAGVHNPQIHELTQRAARGWRDPWMSLAALEHERRADLQRLQLQRLGTTVIAANEDQLQDAVFAEYRKLRRARRV